MALSEAIIATYITIHIPRSPSSHSETIAISLQELQQESANPEGVAFRQRKRAVGLNSAHQSVNDAGVCGSLLALARLLVTILGARFFVVLGRLRPPGRRGPG